jgi:phage terminase small subunit
LRYKRRAYLQGGKPEGKLRSAPQFHRKLGAGGTIGKLEARLALDRGGLATRVPAKFANASLSRPDRNRAINTRSDLGAFMRGRKPIPTHLRLIRGNPSKRPILPEPEPTLPSVPPEPPPYLTGHGAGEWRRLAPGLHRLGLLSVLDTAAFGAYCQSYSIWREATDALANPELDERRDPLRKIGCNVLHAIQHVHPLFAPL